MNDRQKLSLLLEAVAPSPANTQIAHQLGIKLSDRVGGTELGPIIFRLRARGKSDDEIVSTIKRKMDLLKSGYTGSLRAHPENIAIARAVNRGLSDKIGNSHVKELINYYRSIGFNHDQIVAKLQKKIELEARGITNIIYDNPITNLFKRYNIVQYTPEWNFLRSLVDKYKDSDIPENELFEIIHKKLKTYLHTHSNTAIYKATGTTPSTPIGGVQVRDFIGRHKILSRSDQQIIDLIKHYQEHGKHKTGKHVLYSEVYDMVRAVIPEIRSYTLVPGYDGTTVTNYIGSKKKKGFTSQQVADMILKLFGKSPNTEHELTSKEEQAIIDAYSARRDTRFPTKYSPENMGDAFVQLTTNWNGIVGTTVQQKIANLRHKSDINLGTYSYEEGGDDETIPTNPYTQRDIYDKSRPGSILDKE